MDRLKQICIELANLAKRKHYFCEDSWYSCPKAEGGCANDAEGDECTCGADAYNAKVNEMLAAALAEPEPEGPTPSAELLPAAQAVLNAFRADWKDEHLKQDVKCLAAALRAAADQILPSTSDWYESFMLLANELEAQ